MRIVLANPRGFCAGVDRAIEIVRRALALLPSPIYVRHDIVHNRHVVESLKAEGAVFVEELRDVPDGSVVIISAHGAAPAVYDEAEGRRLKVIDATCPLVTKVHLEVVAQAAQRRSLIVIGHRGHPEIAGTMGCYDAGPECRLALVETEEDAETVSVPDSDRVAYVTQTTLSVTDTARIVAILRRRFPALCAPRTDDICAATDNRQAAARALAGQCNLVIVIGAPHSSNSRRLVEVAEQSCPSVYFIEDASAIRPEWFEDAAVAGITSGASVPDHIVRAVVCRIQAIVPETRVESFGQQETLVFRLPREVTAPLLLRWERARRAR
jgi:4-hydroxy-3-methylbut-2-enyl diphosphate reductase